jgi:hypothetical protein
MTRKPAFLAPCVVVVALADDAGRQTHLRVAKAGGQPALRVHADGDPARDPVSVPHDSDAVTIDDAGAYARPWDVKFQARLTGLPGDELLEYICQENNQYGIAQGH